MKHTTTKSAAHKPLLFVLSAQQLHFLLCISFVGQMLTMPVLSAMCTLDFRLCDTARPHFYSSCPFVEML